MDVSVEWTGRNKAGTLLHKSSDTELSDEFNPAEDREKINNMLKKEIAEFYQVDRDSISLLNVNIAEKHEPEPTIPEPVSVAISEDELNNIYNKDEYDMFVEGINNNIDVKIAELTNEINNLTKLRNKFEDLKKRIK